MYIYVNLNTGQSVPISRHSQTRAKFGDFGNLDACSFKLYLKWSKHSKKKGEQEKLLFCTFNKDQLLIFNVKKKFHTLQSLKICMFFKGIRE